MTHILPTSFGAREHIWGALYKGTPLTHCLGHGAWCLPSSDHPNRTPVARLPRMPIHLHLQSNGFRWSWPLRSS